MTSKPKGLGKGFSALVDPQRGRPAPAAPKKEDSSLLPLERIWPNRHQPRQRFNEEALQTLAASLKREGMLQPLAVRPHPDKPGEYELIAGERRLRAAKIAGLTEAPCVVIATDEAGLGLLALVENLMREDLNPVDEAEAYQQLTDNFDLTHEEIAARLGRSRVHVTNTIRLLGLPEIVRAYLAAGELSAGHGRALLALADPEERIAVAQEALARGLSVRETEALVKNAARLLRRKKDKRTPAAKAHPYAYLVDELRVHLGTKVSLTGGKKKGTVVVHYFSAEELTRLVELLRR